jgi:hypothetical protein
MRSVRLLAVAAVIACASCSTYDPLTSDPDLRTAIGNPIDDASAVKVTFLGTTTFVIEDKKQLFSSTASFPVLEN